MFPWYMYTVGELGQHDWLLVCNFARFSCIC